METNTEIIISPGISRPGWRLSSISDIPREVIQEPSQGTSIYTI